MLHFLHKKRSLRFVLISSLLTVAAIGAALVSAVAGQVGEDEIALFGSKAALVLALMIVIYVVPRLARSVRLEYLHSEFSVQVSNPGLIFGVLILLVMILALTSNNNLVYLVLAVLLATMFVSWIASRLSLAGVGASVQFPDHIFVDEAVGFEITLVNRKRLMPAFSVAVATSEQRGLQSPRELAEIAYYPIVAAKTQARMRIERTFAKRGVYPVYGYLLVTRFPFGFIEQRRFIEAPGEIAVYPQPQPLDGFHYQIQLALGRVESRLKGSGSDLYAIRQYISSDHHHYIDWKATAKTTRLMVREFTRDDDRRVLIVFDPEVEKERAIDPLFIEKFERAITLAAGLIDFFIRDGAEVRLLTGRDDSGYGTGQMHCYAMLRLLAQLAPETEKDGSDDQERRRFSLSPGTDEQFRILITSSDRGQAQSTFLINIEEG